MSQNEWVSDVLFPGANAEGYRLIYEAETWLRRIGHAALLVAEGPAWASRLKPDLRNRLEAESKRNSQRWYMGIDSGEELLWSTTHGQLAEVLRLPAIQDTLVALSGMDGDVLAARLTSISTVRNALAHNRAISDDSLTILRGDLTVIHAGVDRFRGMTLYAESEIESLSSTSADLDEVIDDFQELEQQFLEQQVYVSASEHFVQFVRLPVEPFGVWPHAGRLRAALGLASQLTVCVLANKQGDELQVVIPRNLPSDDKREVLRRFLTTDLLAEAWTNKPPEDQHPATVSWARLWFYENRRPAGA